MRRSVACTCLVLVAAAALGAHGQNATLDRELPGHIQRPTDIRWLDDATLLVSAPSSGLLEVGISGSELTASSYADNLGRFRRWVHLGVSPSHVAGAYIAFNSWWWPRERREDIDSLSIEYVADLDLYGDRLLVAGLRRDDEGDLAADGAMAWLIDLAQAEVEARPVLPLPGNALRSLQDCALGLLPKVRFMADGAFLLLPGVEPLLLHYDSSARLIHTWQTDDLNLEQECVLSDEQKRRFNTDVGVRQGWLNQRRVVDELLPLPTGPGLLVRSRADGVTRWELLRLDAEESGSGPGWRSVPLSLTSPSPWMRARADVREERLAVLLASVAPAGQTAPASRILVFELKP